MSYTAETNSQTDSLLEQNALLRSENEKLRKETQSQKKHITYIEEQLKWLKNQIFGKKSERFVDSSQPDQLEFPGFESVEQKEEEPETTSGSSSSKKRKKRTSNGQDTFKVPSDIPFTEEYIDLPEEEKKCPKTGVPLKKIGEEVSCRLAYLPGRYIMKKIIRPKYVHPSEEERGVFCAEMPDRFLPQCRADESFLAGLVVNKFADHLPLYRIQESLSREGIEISRSLLSQWVIKTGLALSPIFQRIHKKILNGDSSFVDETPIKIQDSPRAKTAYIWVLVGGEQSGNPPYRAYFFKESREHHHAADILKDFEGVVHSDKYGAYEDLAKNNDQITWMPCFAHIRRKFYEAQGSGDTDLRAWILRKIKYLFLLEKVAWARGEEARLQIRTEKQEPILDEIGAAVEERLLHGSDLPKSKMKKALNYYIGLKPYIKNYLRLPWARLDNNVAERAIRPLTVGRKNWLFLGSKKSGYACQVLFSIVQTCRAMNINPRDYLEDVMKKLPSHPANRVDELLPGNWTPP